MKWKILVIKSLLFFLSPLYAQEAVLDISFTDLYQYSNRLHQMPSYSYPYYNLAGQLIEHHEDTLSLFSYGSLIDEHSASRTLSPRALETRRPALAFGVKRTFNRDVPIKPDSRWGIPCNPNARGMLNVEKTEELKSFINGVLVDVPLEDIEALLTREVGYDLIPIVVANWQGLLTGKFEFAIAYILSAPLSSSYVSLDILPRPGYYELTRDAAMQFGPLFGLLWYNTTFMADGKSSVDIWEKWLKEGDPRTCRTTFQPISIDDAR